MLWFRSIPLLYLLFEQTYCLGKSHLPARFAQAIKDKNRKRGQVVHSILGQGGVVSPVNNHDNDNVELAANAQDSDNEEETMACKQGLTLADVCMDINYNKEDLPEGFFNISMDYYITELENVDDTGTKITVKGSFALNWLDKGIAYVGNSSSYIILEDQSLYFIPRTTLDYLEEFIPLNFLQDFNFFVLHTWYDSSNVMLFLEGKFKIGCVMDFSDYPFDKQRCMFAFGLYDLEVDSAMVIMDVVDIKEGSQRPLQYKISTSPMEGQDDLFDTSQSNNYSRNGIWFELERKSNSLVLQFMMPSGMFVMCSWISFVMPIDGGERAGLLVTLFLVLISMYLAAVQIAPKADTINALETWIIASIVFVFLTLLEYALAMIIDFGISAKGSSKSNHLLLLSPLKSRRQTDPSPRPSTIHVDSKDKEMGNEEEKPKAHKKVDNLSLIIMPILAIIFNVIYWSAYLL